MADLCADLEREEKQSLLTCSRVPWEKEASAEQANLCPALPEGDRRSRGPWVRAGGPDSLALHLPAMLAPVSFVNLGS